EQALALLVATEERIGDGPPLRTPDGDPPPSPRHARGDVDGAARGDEREATDDLEAKFREHELLVRVNRVRALVLGRASLERREQPLPRRVGGEVPVAHDAREAERREEPASSEGAA